VSVFRSIVCVHRDVDGAIGKHTDVLRAAVSRLLLEDVREIEFLSLW
jgi:hypothetical protein